MKLALAVGCFLAGVAFADLTSGRLDPEDVSKGAGQALAAVACR